MKKNVTKATKTAEQAARELLAELEQKELQSAFDKLQTVINAWEKETGCTFVLSGQFYGGEIQSKLNVIKKPNQ